MENSLVNTVIKIFAIGTAIGVHEFGHSFVAYKLGDPTSRNMGRMTPNPLVHINPIGLLVMFLVGIGFTNPVQINSSNFKNKKKGLILTSFAGPLFNVITAILCVLCIKFIPLESARIVLMSIVGYNIAFASFNLIPIIPPLDGWQILKQFIPLKYYNYIYQYESMSLFIFFILILTNLYMVLLSPISNVLTNLVFLFL